MKYLWLLACLVPTASLLCDQLLLEETLNRHGRLLHEIGNGSSSSQHSFELLVNLDVMRVDYFGGTLGELVPSAVAIVEKNFVVARGPTANIEIGVQAKTLAKAMIKQIDRVIGDLQRQVAMFKKHGGNPLCIGFVGINWSNSYMSYEGRRRFPTDGKKYKHPIQEAADAEARLRKDALPVFDEFLILNFMATNIRPYPFAWKDYGALELEYNALLTRVSREYDVRF